jgi:hypothetical protein
MSQEEGKKNSVHPLFERASRLIEFIIKQEIQQEVIEITEI